MTGRGGRRFLLPGGLGLALLAVGCQAPAPPAGARLTAVTTFYPLGEFARQVARERAEVSVLVPSGVEPHDWEPSPADVARLREARLFVYNGGGFEPWVERVRQSAVGAETVVIDATAGLPLEVTGPRGRVRDPHVWLDPVLAQAQVELIRAGFVKADPAGEAAYAGHAADLVGRLRVLHEAFERGLADCTRREIVVSHAAFGHLAQRYRLVQVPIRGVSPEAEPSPAEIADIVRFARRQGAKYVFSETLLSPKLAETLAREVGARNLVLNPIEGLRPEEAAAGKTYLDLMRENLDHLRTGLECR